MAGPITHVLNPQTGQRESVEQILRSKYPAKAHAKRVADFIIKNGGDPKGVIYLESQKKRMNEVRHILLILNGTNAKFRIVMRKCTSGLLYSQPLS